MMKKYKIILNILDGNSYTAEVEEIGAGYAPAPAAAAAPASASASAPAEPRPEKPQTAPAGAQIIKCPMPGTILDIRVKPGDTVAEGQVLIVFEAMKMENEILAPRAGVVDHIQVLQGASVNTGDELLSLK